MAQNGAGREGSPRPRGLGVTHVSWADVKAAIKSHLDSFAPVQVVTLTPEMCVRASRDESFQGLISAAGIVVADGVGVVWGEGRLTGRRPEKIPGIDLAAWTLDEVARIGGRIYLLGSKPEVAQKASEKLSQDHPGLSIAGWHHGYFESTDEPEIVRAIASTKPHLLLVGMGSPKQEEFIARNLQALGCVVAIGVGGAFDVWSGSIKRAPAFFRETGTEWLYRTLTQPRARMARVGHLLRFVVMVLRKPRS
jgi:N-acetylglucosaminyldiphosphoundecaprenol N-acetyl-beta-D-mannosaminyltransferase